MRLSPRDPVEWRFFDVLASAYFNAARLDEGPAASRRLIALWPEYDLSDPYSCNILRRLP
jgi:hypothetical protein